MTRYTSETSPYVELSRDRWQTLRNSWPMVLDETELETIRGLGEQIDLNEVAEIYLPLSRLIHLQVEAQQKLYSATTEFLGDFNKQSQVPFVIAVAGSVAVGKSTTARLLQTLLSRWESHPRVDLVTTDGFLYPNKELRRRGLTHRKGFPESYDRRALLRFVSAIKSGASRVTAAVYSHDIYDIVPGKTLEIDQPDILILEGLNVLQPGRGFMVSDLLDFSVYVDARIEDIERWYIERFLQLRSTAFADPQSHFHFYADLTDNQATLAAQEIWDTINLPNLVESILPTRPRATLVLSKNSDHSVQRIRLRKI